jgi:hypothetical protein
MNTPAAHGKTFHLSPETPLTARDLVVAGHEYFNSRGVEFVDPSDNLGGQFNEYERSALENIGIYEDYEESDPTFDRSNLLEHAAHLPCPAIDKTMLQRFWKYGEQDKWGRRRVPPTPVPPSLNRHLTGLISKPGSEELDEVYVLNLRILGPGGGEWTATIRGGRLTDLHRGLSRDVDATWEVDYSTFWQLCSHGVHGAIDQVRHGLTSHGESIEQLAESICKAMFAVRTDVDADQSQLENTLKGGVTTHAE